VIVSARQPLRKRIWSYLALLVVFVAWFVVTDYFDREQQARIAAIRDMHRQGLAFDIDAVMSDPEIRREKRLVTGAMFLTAVLVALEWRARRPRG